MDGIIMLWVPIAVALGGASIAAVTDVREFRVRNALTFPLIISGLVYHTLTGGLGGLTASLTGMFLGLGVLIVPWVLGLMGAGDVKLLAGIGAWLLAPYALMVFVATALFTCLVALALIVYRGKVRESLLTVRVIFYRFVALGAYLRREDLAEELSAQPDRRLRVIPFAAMVPVGIIGMVLWLAWSQNLAWCQGLLPH